MKFEVQLHVEEYDNDFKFYLSGDYIEEGYTVSITGFTFQDTKDSLLDRLSYGDGWGSDHTKDPEGGTWANWAKRMILEMFEKIENQFLEDPESKCETIHCGGNRVFTLTVSKFEDDEKVPPVIEKPRTLQQKYERALYALRVIASSGKNEIATKALEDLE